MTMLKMAGTLPRNFSMFTGSGHWRTSDREFTVSFTLSAVSPHPFSRPHSWNLQNNFVCVNHTNFQVFFLYTVVCFLQVGITFVRIFRMACSWGGYWQILRPRSTLTGVCSRCWGSHWSLASAKKSKVIKDLWYVLHHDLALMLSLLLLWVLTSPRWLSASR